MNKRIVLIVILSLVLLLVFLPTFFKVQEKSSTIAETYHNPMRLGKIQSIQTDADGHLYIWNSNHSLIKMDFAAGEKTFFFQGAERGGETVFCIIDNELHFILYRTVEVYDTDGRLLRRGENRETVQNSKETNSDDTLYTIKDYLLFQEVWQITQREKKCIYRRLSITNTQAFLICFAIFFFNVICILKHIGMKVTWHRK